MKRPYRAAGIANGLLHEVNALRQCTPPILQLGILCKVGHTRIGGRSALDGFTSISGCRQHVQGTH